jgi:hypothetical protein
VTSAARRPCPWTSQRWYKRAGPSRMFMGGLHLIGVALRDDGAGKSVGWREMSSLHPRRVAPYQRVPTSMPSPSYESDVALAKGAAFPPTATTVVIIIRRLVYEGRATTQNTRIPCRVVKR